MKDHKLSKNYKFPLGAVFAILAGIAVVMNLMLYAVQRTAFSIFYFQQAGFMGLLNSSIYALLFFAEQTIMLAALLALAVFLILKQRKKILIALPFAMTVTYFIAIFSYALDFISGYNFTFQTLVNIFAYVLSAVSCLLLAVIIIFNSSNRSNRLAFMPWIAPIPAILGHFILFFISTVNLTSIFSFAMANISYSDYFLYALSVLLGNVRSVLFYAVFGILFALTIFFAARWITNPYKKSSQIEKAESEQITE